jgi:predicted RNA-binding protein YlxR (DUF448 family)
MEQLFHLHIFRRRYVEFTILVRYILFNYEFLQGEIVKVLTRKKNTRKRYFKLLMECLGKAEKKK